MIESGAQKKSDIEGGDTRRDTARIVSVPRRKERPKSKGRRGSLHRVETLLRMKSGE